MLIRALCFSGLVAVLATTAALSNDYGPNPSSYSTQMNGRHAGRMRLPMELKIVWHHEEHARLKGMPKEQRHGWLKRQWLAMTPAQRSRKISELQAKWNALPKDVRQVMLEKKRQKHEQRQAQRAENQGAPHADHRTMQ